MATKDSEKRTDHLLIRSACTKLLDELKGRLSDGWQAPDPEDELIARIHRIERFQEYVKLDEEFNR